MFVFFFVFINMDSNSNELSSLNNDIDKLLFNTGFIWYHPFNFEKLNILILANQTYNKDFSKNT